MEIAFLSSNKLRLELEKQQESFSSHILTLYTDNPGQYIVTMLIGNNIALVIYGIAMAILLQPVIELVTHSETAILITQTFISTLIILVFAEFLPKAFSRLNPNGLLKLFSIPVLIFYLIFYPVSKFTISLSHFILKVFFRVKISNESGSPVFGKPDIDQLVSERSQEVPATGEEDHDMKIFQNALDFSNVKLRECMIPRTELVALNENTPPELVRHSFIESGLSKILIFRESIDNIIGYVNMKDLFREILDLRSLIVPLPIVPESMPANRLLKTFVAQSKNIALVVDEFGGTSGIVTIEDILEEIFGEIEDEHDSSALIERKVNKYEYIFSGRLEIDYLNEKYALNLPEQDDYETLAGLIFHFHESIPKLNQFIRMDTLEFKVLKVSETRIELVQLKILQK